MYIGRPIHFENAPAPSRNRFKFRFALVVFVLLAIVGPIVVGRLLAAPPTGEIPAFMGP